MPARCGSGCDRAARVADTLEIVERKLAVFAERTLPLVEHYRQRGARVYRVRVGVETQPADVVRELFSLPNR